MGDAIKKANVDRSQIWITSKVWFTHMTKEKATESLNITLKDFGIDYIDLLLIHWPYTDGVDEKDGNTLAAHRLEVWETFIALKKEGKIKHIGVSNFQPKHIQQLVEKTGVKPAVNQIIHHPYKVLTETVDYCKKNNIIIEAWAPLAKCKYGILEDPVIVGIAKKYNKESTQVILRWIVQSGHVVIPKSKSKERTGGEHADL